MQNQFTKGTMLLVGLLLAGCSNTPQNTNDTTVQAPETTQTQETTAPEMEIASEGVTILSLSPSITTTLINLGLAENIVGLDIHSLGLENINVIPQLENVETFDAFLLDLESVVALDPDLIFVSWMGLEDPDSPLAPATHLHDRIHTIEPSEDLAHIQEQILYLGAVTETQDTAFLIVDELQAQLDHILNAIALAEPTPRNVYFEISPEPSIFSFGADVFLNDIIEMLHSTNVLNDLSGWVPVSEEIVVDRNPDIIFTNVGYEEDPVGMIINRPGWENVEAVVNEKVFLIDPQASSSSNETIIIPIRQMAVALYPEIDFE